MKGEPMTADLTGVDIENAIRASSDLINPRLNEIDWDEVARLLDAARPSDDLTGLDAAKVSAILFGAVDDETFDRVMAARLEPGEGET